MATVTEACIDDLRKVLPAHAVKVDPALHKEILARYQSLHVKPYKGFIQPRLVPVMDGDNIVDVKIEYPESFFEQMMEYGKRYSLLPLKN